MPLDEVESTIRANLEDGSSRFVFPSSIAAEHWIKEASRMGPRRALARERFLGWDSFKEISVAPNLPGRRPASRELRLVFSADALSRNAKSPFLSSIVPPGHRESWRAFAPAIASSLPQAIRLGRPGGREKAGALADYLALREMYAAFLEARGFFEPGWESARFDARGLRWIIFFPELIDDFSEYEEALSARPESEVLVVRDRPPRSGKLVAHASLLGEIRWALDRIGRAVDSGLADPGDIAVTVPDFPGIKPYIEREAALFGIPVDFRSGTSLAEYPAGRFFALIAKAVDSGFAFPDLRDLVLSGGIPWREREAARDLVAFGLKYSVLCPWKEGARPVDPWLATFRGRGEEWRKAEAFYRGLSAQSKEIAKAGDFVSLKSAWLAMAHSLLDPDGFSEDQDRVFARCVVCMDDLARAQRDAGLEEIPGAFGLFVQSLGGQRYVPRSQPGGVRFYDYRVSAGIRPKMHFILNASQQALTVRSGGCPFLREDLRAALSLEEGDSSEDFIRRYAQSGDDVVFSCSFDGLGGAQMPHGYFLGDHDGGEKVAAVRGPIGDEVDFWAGDAAFPGRVSRIQRKGLEAAARGAFRSDGADFRSSLAPGWGGRALEKLKSLNATMLEAYRSCPFAWFFRQGLDARSDPSGISSFDAKFIGDAVHFALQKLYEAVAAKGPMRKSLLGEYRDLVPGALDAAIRESERKKGMFAGVVLRPTRERLYGVMRDLLEADCSFFDGCSVFGVEMEIEDDDAEIGFKLAGRIDRLMEGPGGLWIIDYKSGEIKQAEYGLEKEEGEELDLQLPAYARLVVSKGKAVGGTLIYGTKDGKYRTIAADSRPPFMGERARVSMSLSELAEAEKLLAATAKAVVSGVRSGDFRTADPAKRGEVCKNCRMRAICREHYQVR